MLRTHPLVSKLLTQLAPAALVTGVGLLMLSNLAKPAIPVPAASGEPAIQAEMVFTPLPQPAAEVEADRDSAAKSPAFAARTAKPKPAAANVAPPRKLAMNESAPAVQAVAPPLQIVPPAIEPADNTMMGKLRGVGTAVRQMPQRAYATVTGWFVEAEPPRPPAPVPAANFL